MNLSDRLVGDPAEYTTQLLQLLEQKETIISNLKHRVENYHRKLKEDEHIVKKIESLDSQYQPADQFANDDDYPEDQDNFDFAEPDDFNNLGLLDEMDG